MPDAPSFAGPFSGDIAPVLAAHTDNVVFGDTCSGPDLSPRDRSLITIASMVALRRQNELPFHLRQALKNGVTSRELVDVIRYQAFYAGWPAASLALQIARRFLSEIDLSGP